MSVDLQNLSVPELLIRRQEMAESVKNNAKNLYEDILCDPYKNISEFEDLFKLYQKNQLPSLKIYILRKMTKIIVDLAPGYKITNEEKENDKFSKDIKNTVVFETNYLKFYIKYISFVSNLQKEITSLDETKKSKNAILTCFVETIVILFKNMLHFNESDKILELTLTSIFNITEKESLDILCTHVHELFLADKNCLLSLRIIEIVLKYSRLHKIPKELMETFIALNFENMSEKDIEKTNKKKQVEKPKKKKQKKKENIQLQKDLIGGEEDSKKIAKNKNKIFQNLFVICFRILKDSKSPNDLLSSTLGVIAKHSQYINMEIYIEMIRCIISYLKNDNLKIKDKLNVILMILKFPNLSNDNFVIDYNFLYEIVYRILFDIIQENDFNCIFNTLIEVVEKLIITRLKDVGYKRCASFVKRMNSLLMFVDSFTASKLIRLISEISKKYPQISKLLDSQSNVGVVFLNDVDHPDHCCPDGIILWEKHLLSNHFDKFLR